MTDDLGILSDGTPRQRRYAPRSRGGCITCRRRRKRCLGSQPECDACHRLQLECVWDARRSVTSHQDSRSGVAHSNKTTQSEPSFSNHQRDRGRSSSGRHALNHISRSPAVFSSSTPRLTPDVVDQRILMSYYIHHFVPNISVAKSSTSFFTSLYVPMAFHCEAVRNTILACASAHLSKTTSDETQSSRLWDLSLRYQKHCHQFLQERISLSGHLQRDSLESLTVILLLIGLEVQNGAHSHKWIHQLECVRKIIRQQGGITAFSRSSWEAECIYHHFLYHDVMSLIMDGVAGTPEQHDDPQDMISTAGTPVSEGSSQAASPPPVLQEADMPWAKYLHRPEDSVGISSPSTVRPPGPSTTSQVHPLLGLSRELFFLIQKIRIVKPIEQSNDQFDPSKNVFFLDLERRISTLQFDAFSRTEPDAARLDVGTRLDLLTLAETYRLAALILLYRRSKAHTHRLPVLAEQVIVLVERIPPGNPAEAGLTYPLFLAGAEIVSEDLILRCAAKLITIRERVKVLNIESVEKVLEAVWRERLNGGNNWDWEPLLRKWQWVINLG